MKAYIEAHGCALNRGEAIEFRSVLSAAGWQLTDDPGAADMNVIATCAVIENTERQMIKRIRQLNSLGKPLIVTGCMASALRGRIEPIAPRALFMGPDRVSDMCRIVGVDFTADWTPEPVPGTFCHIIPIASGCQGSCSYCITRSARGELKSRATDAILGQISRIDTSRGVKELQITSQDSASYGIDMGSSLPELLDSITALDLDVKLRVGMMNPGSALAILDELVRSFSNPKLYKFFHLPVQSGSDRILAAMGRDYRVDDFRMLVSHLREEFPESTLSTDLIVGYPGETPEDHEASVRLLREIRPEIVNVTRFSPRPGTPAAEETPVLGRTAKARSRELTKLRFAIAGERARHRVGQVVDVVVTEKGSGTSMIARTDGYEQAILPRSVDLGSRVRARVVDATPIHLFAEPV